MSETLSSRKERIYLTGFMGSGKSTIGPILANTIGYDFADLDRLIENEAGLSVSAIFREKGEEYFRSLERSGIARVSAMPRTVISLGGGTLVDPENYRRISTTGIIVYLKITPEQIFRRLHHKTDRPLLTNPGGERLGDEQLRTRIMNLYSSREPIYAQSDITVLTDEKKVGITVDQIVKKISYYIR